VRVETTDAFADVLLADRLARAPRRAARLAHAADQALATRLVYGTLAWQGRLDHHLKGLVRMPVADLDPPVRAALRLGLYQLLFLDRVPAYAAVDASVGLARAARGAGAAGLVNAVLRRAAVAGAAGLVLPDPAADPLERLAIEWSHPRWLVERWAAELGRDELPRLLAANNVRGPSAVRANRLSTTPDALRAELAAARASRPRSATPAARPSHVPSTPCWWTRRAAGSARSAGTRSYAGGGARRTSRASPRSSGRSWRVLPRSSAPAACSCTRSARS